MPKTAREPAVNPPPAVPPKWTHERALLKFTITADHLDRFTPVDVDILLYREAGALVWRLSGPLGDPCEALPMPATVAQAKRDVAAVYPAWSPFKPRARWLP